MWGPPIWVKDDLAHEELSGAGSELECSLNRLTAQAESAVLDSDPVESYLRAISAQDMSGARDPFKV